MKKLTTALLCLLMVFSCAFCVSAEDSITMKAYQDENGDLIISGPDYVVADLVKGFIESDEGNELNKYGVNVSEVDNNWWGAIENVTRIYGGETYPSIAYEKVDNTTLKVKKQILVDSGFVNGTYRFYLSYEENNRWYSVDFESLVKLDLGVTKTPNQQTRLTFVGSVPKVVEGESTKIDSSKFALKGADGQNIASEDFGVYWVEEYKYEDQIFYTRTEDETFKAGKEYYLLVEYRYISGKNDINSKEIRLSHDNLVFVNDTKFYGATAGTGLITGDYADFLCKGFVESTPTVATKNANDVVKTVVNGETKAWMAFNLTSVTADAKPEVIELIKADKVKPSVSAPKEEEKSLSFEVKPVDDQGNEVDTKGIWVTFSVNVGKKFEEGTKVNVLHYHDGEDEAVETLVGVVDGSGDVVLSTNMGFSTFKVVEAPVTAIVPETAPEAPAPAAPTQAGPKDTNADGVISCEEEMGSKNWVWSDSKKACVYKVSNTSTK